MVWPEGGTGPEPWRADPKSKSALRFCNLHHSSIVVQNWGVLYYILLYYAILCHTMPYYAILCHTMPYYATITIRTGPEIGVLLFGCSWGSLYGRGSTSCPMTNCTHLQDSRRTGPNGSMYNHPGVDKTVSHIGTYYGSFKDHSLSAPRWL